MSNIIFDVGLHKTGSSSRQHFFKKYLTKKGFDVILNSFDMKTHINLDKKTIVSAEGLSGMSHSPFEKFENRIEIIWKLSRCYPDAKIILVLRDKQDWMKSAFNQYSYSCFAFSWKNFWLQYDKRLLDWELYINYLKSLFKEVYVCNFEQLKSNPYLFYKGMCDFIGVDMPLDFKNIKRNIKKPTYKIIVLQYIDFIFKSKRLHTVISHFIKRIN